MKPLDTERKVGVTIRKRVETPSRAEKLGLPEFPPVKLSNKLAEEYRARMLEVSSGSARRET